MAFPVRFFRAYSINEYNISQSMTFQIVLVHCALGAILDLLYKSKTSGGKVMKFSPSYTFTKRNILVKKFWPLKARKAMLK